MRACVRACVCVCARARQDPCDVICRRKMQLAKRRALARSRADRRREAGGARGGGGLERLLKIREGGGGGRGGLGEAEATRHVPPPPPPPPVKQFTPPPPPTPPTPASERAAAASKTFYAAAADNTGAGHAGHAGHASVRARADRLWGGGGVTCSMSARPASPASGSPTPAAAHSARNHSTACRTKARAPIRMRVRLFRAEEPPKRWEYGTGCGVVCAFVRACVRTCVRACACV